MQAITLTPVQLTQAQMGKEITLNTGETLSALPIRGGWKYIVCFEGQVGLIRYADNGIAAALWAINASEEEYNA